MRRFQGVVAQSSFASALSFRSAHGRQTAVSFRERVYPARMDIAACKVVAWTPNLCLGLSFPSGRRILRIDLARIFMRSRTMLLCTTLRVALPAVLAAALLPAAAFAQSQDTQSVAEAARRARAQKKNSEKPAKVITDETLDVKKGDVQSATAEQLRIPGTPETQAQPAPAKAPSSAVQNEKKASEDEKLAKELAALKEQIKQAQGDLELLQREQSLEQDNYYSKTDYAHDTP